MKKNVKKHIILLTIFLLLIITIFFSKPVFADTENSIEKDITELTKGGSTPALSPYSPYVAFISKNICNTYEQTQVRYLQKELNSIMGYTFDTDGKMTVQLRNAVKEFQRAYGLEVDGLVGPNTRLYLNAAYKYQKIIVSGSYLNIRTNPTTSSLSLAKVPRGTILSYIETAYINGVKWYKISYNNIVGYVSAQYTKDTFVEVDITSQTLRLYKERLLILDTPITTGKPGSYDTQKGYYSIMFIDQDRYLQPSNVHVDYWMRFNNAKAQGLHDASWRVSSDGNVFKYFGGTRYKQPGTAGTKYSGSKGCVNIPPNKMPIIFQNTGLGTPVYVH